MLGHDSNGEIDFKEFVEGLCKFSSHGDKESKLRFAFKIYDMDNDGYISNGELFQVMILFNSRKAPSIYKISILRFLS